MLKPVCERGQPRGALQDHGARDSGTQTQGGVTHFVAGLGTCGTIAGTGRFLKDQRPDVQVVGVYPNEGHDIPGVRSLRQLQQTQLYRPDEYDRQVEGLESAGVRPVSPVEPRGEHHGRAQLRDGPGRRVRAGAGRARQTSSSSSFGQRLQVRFVSVAKHLPALAPQARAGNGAGPRSPARSDAGERAGQSGPDHRRRRRA